MKSIERRRLLAAIGATPFLAPLASFAQGAGTARIGFLYFGTRRSAVDSLRYQAFIDSLRALGHIEGKNIVIEARFADGKIENIKALAAELVKLKADVIVATGSQTYRPLQQATSTIPIVITVDSDPVANGYAVSMARPGGNITGFSNSGADIVAKYLELLKTVTPTLARVGVMLNPGNGAHPQQLVRIMTAAQKTGVRVILASAATEHDLVQEFSMLAREHADAVVFLNDTFFVQQLRQLAALSLKHKLSSIYSIAEYAESGGLMSYGPDIVDNFRRAAVYVDKILKGAKAGELPFEQPTRYYLIVNRKTARALNLTIPQDLLVRADKVLE
ncbi:MAG: hypothetical protein JWN94_2172 [Betaproteobacteria bacterium]|nr:hypothetical protein [Betaproteobacteria bacterium]